MVKKTYGYTIYKYHKWYKRGPKQITDRIYITVTGQNADELAEKFERKLREIQEGLKAGEYVDDIVWSNVEEWKEEEE